MDKVIARDDKTFEWFLNISDIETEDLFNSRLSEKLEIKIEKSIEVRDTKYTLAFDSIISVDRAKAYRKQYNKYILENKWTDIKYGVYVR